MTRNLWIGTPNSGLREITQAARSWDRTADLGVTEFRSLDGTVTLSRARSTPRRVKLSWEWLEPADARHLDGLARRITSYGAWDPDGYAPGPVVLIDPAAGNLLGPLQSAGRCGPSDAEQGWFAASGEVAFESWGSFAKTATPATDESAIGWRHGTWPGWPVPPDAEVSWQLPSYWKHLTAPIARLDWKDSSGDLISSTTAQGTLVTGTAPRWAAFVTPVGIPGSAGFTVDFGGAALALGEPAVEGVPGDGCPAMAITACTDVPAPRLPYRNVSIDLVEVNGAVR